MPDFQDNLWAPWRMDYIRSANEEKSGGCFLCAYAANPNLDRAQLVLWRNSDVLVLLNRYPYTNGHLLIAPTAHHATLDQLTDATLQQLSENVRDAQILLRETLRPNGYNIGMNLGTCAGAGLPDHLHWHVVPRWNGDTNFMPVIANVRVIPESLEANYKSLSEMAARLGFAATTT